MTIGTRKNQLKNACASPPHILHEKTQRFFRGWQEWHVNLQSRWRPGAFYMRKHNDFSGVGGNAHVHFTYIYSRNEAQTHFTRENTRISPRSAGRARTFHVNLQSKWRPGAFYTRKHNDFSGVGGGLRRGCIVIRNRDGVGWGWWHSFALAHMLKALRNGLLRYILYTCPNL